MIGVFNERSAKLRATLAGYPLVEANLTPEEHIGIQQALIAKGLLTDRVQKYGVKADGQFGPNTRAAIQSYQRSIGAQPTGFLSNEQQSALLESPEEIEARAARIEAEAKSKKIALEAKQQAEEQARLEEERAKQEAADREQKRLDEEAAKAADWRARIEEAQKKDQSTRLKTPT